MHINNPFKRKAKTVSESVRIVDEDYEGGTLIWVSHTSGTSTTAADAPTEAPQPSAPATAPQAAATFPITQVGAQVPLTAVPPQVPLVPTAPVVVEQDSQGGTVTALPDSAPDTRNIIERDSQGGTVEAVPDPVTPAEAPEDIPEAPQPKPN
jgi:hypothetical protein